MNKQRTFIYASLALSIFSVTTSHAVTVGFDDEYFGVEGLEDNFIAADPFDAIQNTSSPLIEFVDGAVSFSGGVILRDPANTDSDPMAPSFFPGVYYGTAFSPTTSINEIGYLNPLVIDIDASENFTNISGSLLSGLNTNAPEYTGMALASYEVSFFSGTTLLGTDATGGIDFTDTTTFSFDSFSMESAIFGAAITRVEIEANPLDLNSLDAEFIAEWDFLLDFVDFESGVNPIPVPAALPLFVSALLGGLVIARPKKKLK